MFEKPGQVTLKTFSLPSCGPKEIICKTIYSFVSPGTELRILGGQKESKGRFPLIPGYAWVSRVVEIGANIKGWDVGQLVTGRNPLPVPGINALWGGQASCHRVQVSGYDCVLKLPQGDDPWHYVHAEVAAISWRGTSIAYPAPGETAVVIGQGLIGAFAARWLIYFGAKVMVVDFEESRLKQARKWGAASAFNGREPNVREQILNRCPGGVDIVIEASSSISGVKLAGSLLRQPAPKVLKENYPIADMHDNAHMWPRLVLLATYLQTLETERGMGVEDYLKPLIDIKGVPPKYIGPVLKEGEDIWGVRRKPVSYGLSSYDEIEYHPLAEIKNFDQLQNYRWPTTDWFDYSSIPEQIDQTNSEEEYCIIAGGGNPFETSWAMIGPSHAIQAGTHPENITTMFDTAERSR